MSFKIQWQTPKISLPPEKLDKMNDAYYYDHVMNTETEQNEDFLALYRRAFKDYGASALWSSLPVPDPTREDALAITRSLRVEGDLKARHLAEQIEKACRATV